MDLNLSVGGVALSPVFVALIALARQYLGMPKSWAIWVNLGLNIASYVGIALLLQRPEYLEPTVNWLNILVGFLTVAGVYDRTQKVGGEVYAAASKRLSNR